MSGTIETVDVLAVALVVLIVGGIVGAFFLYLRTAYRKGGWIAVRRDFWIAIVVLTAFVVERILQNLEIQRLKRTIDGWFQHR
jgi:uncharacterized protein (DUF983 family)